MDKAEVIPGTIPYAWKGTKCRCGGRTDDGKFADINNHHDEGGCGCHASIPWAYRECTCGGKMEYEAYVHDADMVAVLEESKLRDQPPIPDMPFPYTLYWCAECNGYLFIQAEEYDPYRQADPPAPPNP